jgi:hypothetical protein
LKFEQVVTFEDSFAAAGIDLMKMSKGEFMTELRHAPFAYLLGVGVDQFECDEDLRDDTFLFLPYAADDPLLPYWERIQTLGSASTSENGVEQHQEMARK